jgi:hypothetical protein
MLKVSDRIKFISVIFIFFQIMKFPSDKDYPYITSLCYFPTYAFNFTLHRITYFPVYSIDHQIERTWFCFYSSHEQ